MSISKDLEGPDKFYFWFQPSPNPDAEKEIVIWLNGGVSLDLHELSTRRGASPELEADFEQTIAAWLFIS